MTSWSSSIHQRIYSLQSSHSTDTAFLSTIDSINTSDNTRLLSCIPRKPTKPCSTHTNLLQPYRDRPRYPTQQPTTMDFFGDFCLTCDAQTNGSSFCSQACRLTDLDNYTLSMPASPSYCDSSTIHRRSTGSAFGLYLPPAIDFSIYRVPSSTSVESVKSTKSSSRRISEQARNDLNDYATSFDQTRTLRRRISMQSNEEAKMYSRR